MHRPTRCLLLLICALIALSACAPKRDLAAELPSAPSPAPTAEPAPVVVGIETVQGSGTGALDESVSTGTIEPRVIDDGAVCTPLADGGYEITGGLVEIAVTGVALTGTVRTTDGGSVRILLSQGANLLAAFETESMLDLSVLLDAESLWTLVAETRADAVVNGDRTFSNVTSNGFDLYYNCESGENAYLDRATVPFSGGGALTPMI